MKKILFIIFVTVYGFVYAQTPKDVQNIIKNYDQSKISLLKDELLSNHDKLIKYAKDNKIDLNYSENNKKYHLSTIIDDTPIYYTTYNLSAIKSTRAFFMHNGQSFGLNIEGQNMVAYVWDGGIARASHNEFYYQHQSKISIGDGATDEANHATHVTGSIVAVGDDPLALGAAPKATCVSFDWDLDQSEVVTQASQGMLLSNHSYGVIESQLPDWAFGAYVSESKNWDNIMFQAPYYLNVSAAGNAGYDNNSNNLPLDGISNRDKLSLQQTAKNGLVVGNAQDLGVNLDGDLIGTPIINSSSSQGPTDDYRIKPDIVGNGTSVYSCTSSSDNSYDTYDGTSMASPNVMGTLLLIQQLYHQVNGNFCLAATLKGLALHSADDGGAQGPDPVFGWGYLSAKKMVNIIQDNNSIIQEKTMQNNTPFTFQVNASGNEPLKISISWTDRANNNVNNGVANSHTPVLVADLDVRVTKDGVTYFPWKLTGANSNTQGDNLVDPYERVDIDNASGIYTVTINHKNSLPNGHQNYSLIVSGISSSSLVVNSIDLLNKFDVWPNPSTGTINISNYLNDKKTSVFVYNLIGKKVFQNSFTSNTTSFNLNSLNKGVYFVKILNNNKIFTKKLILK